MADAPNTQTSLERRLRRDRIFLNNPVIMQGLGLAPLIVAATTTRNAALLSLAVMLMLTPTRVLAALFSRFVHYRFRGAVYAITSAAVFAIMYFLMTYFIPPADFVPLGIYLPLLIVDPIMLKRYERVQNERLKTALRKGFITALGYSLVLLIIGSAREILGAGTWLGKTVLPVALLPMAQLPSGGFLLLALLMALWRSAVRTIRASMAPMEEEEAAWTQ